MDGIKINMQDGASLTVGGPDCDDEIPILTRDGLVEDREIPWVIWATREQAAALISALASALAEPVAS